MGSILEVSLAKHTRALIYWPKPIFSVSSVALNSCPPLPFSKHDLQEKPLISQPHIVSMSMLLYILDCLKNQLKKKKKKTQNCKVFSDTSYSLCFSLYTFSTLLIISIITQYFNHHFLFSVFLPWVR